ncbi:MAG: cadherin repeat domain-containing protein, partial [Cyanobacteria bacterium J06573_2]
DYIQTTTYNSSPTDLNLDKNSIDENVAASTVVGTFTTTDSDSENTFTYSLVAGIGDTDNAVFEIVNNQLQIKASPDFETQSSYNIRVRTTDSGGLSFEKELTVNVDDLNEAPTVITVNGTRIDNSLIESYDVKQDNPNQGTVTVLPNNQINLIGNRWQKAEINTTITANTVLRFEFAASGEGEIQGLGFDNDDIVKGTDGKRFFQIGGSQNWGIQNLDGFVTGQLGDKDIYEIQIGQFFTGDFRYLTIANDHDVKNSDSEAQFSNIEIFETAPDLLNISIDEITETKEVEFYGDDSQIQNLTTVVGNSNQLKLEGNGWKSLDITGYQVDADTQLFFEFKTNGEGEIQGIGFDSNNNINRNDDGQHFFQLAGSQSWGIEDSQYINSLGTSEDGFTSYSIHVGQLFTGEFNYLTFGNDHDVNSPIAVGEFRNISLG